MSVTYKLVQKSHPYKKDEPKKWYAVPKSATAQSAKQMTRSATANTSISAYEMQAALQLLADYVPSQLIQGHTVHIPGVGNLRLSFKSDGVSNVEDFNASTMIKDVKLVFKPDEEMRTAVLGGLTFEDGGVLADGIEYGSRTAYLKVKSGGTTGGDSSTDVPSDL